MFIATVVLWSLSTGMAAPPAVENVTLAGASTRPAAPSRILWSVPTKAPSYGSGAVGDIDGDGKPEIVFGAYFNDEHLYALNGEDGSILWKFKSDGGPIDTSVLICDLTGDRWPEIVFGDSAYGTLFCLDGRGKAVWKFKGQSGTDSPAAAADLDGDGKVEVVYGTMMSSERVGHVNVLAGKSGNLKWTVKVPGHIQSEPGLVDVNGDGVLDVLVTNWMGDGKLRSLDGKTGAELWTFTTDDWIYHGISAADFDRDGKPEIVVADRKGHVWLLRAESGREVWEAKLEGELDGMVFGPTSLVDVEHDGIPEIVVCGMNLHLLDAKGQVRWCNRYGNRSIARGVAVADVDDDGVDDLLFGQGATLRVVRSDTGEELWSEDLRQKQDPNEDIDNAPLVLDLDADGRLDVFVVIGRGLSGKTQKDNYGRAVALRAGKGRPKPGNKWETFRGGPRRLGTDDPHTGAANLR